jgi:hypothetical protein
MIEQGNEGESIEARSRTRARNGDRVRESTRVGSERKGGD